MLRQAILWTVCLEYQYVVARPGTEIGLAEKLTGRNDTDGSLTSNWDIK